MSIKPRMAKKVPVSTRRIGRLALKNGIKFRSERFLGNDTVYHYTWKALIKGYSDIFKE
jgi:hypothetical protein